MLDAAADLNVSKLGGAEDSLKAGFPRSILRPACVAGRKNHPPEPFPVSRLPDRRIRARANGPCRAKECDRPETSASTCEPDGDRRVCKRHLAANSARSKNRGGGWH